MLSFGLVSFGLALLAPVPLQRAVQPQRASADVQMALGSPMDRRGALAGFAAAALGAAAPVFAAGTEDQYKLSKDYILDAKKMLENMRAATELARGNPQMVRPALHRPDPLGRQRWQRPARSLRARAPPTTP